jgi:hypothetical protein
MALTSVCGMLFVGNIIAIATCSLGSIELLVGSVKPVLPTFTVF